MRIYRVEIDGRRFIVTARSADEARGAAELRYGGLAVVTEVR